MTEWNTHRPPAPASGDLHTYNNMTYRARQEADKSWVWDAIRDTAGASHGANTGGLIDVFDISIHQSTGGSGSHTVPNYVAGQRLLALHPARYWGGSTGGADESSNHIHELPAAKVYDSKETLNMWNDKGTIRWYTDSDIDEARTILRFGPVSADQLAEISDTNYANLLKRVETLESTSGNSGNQATGIYTGGGNGSYTTTVNLGFRPKVVRLIEDAANVMLYEDSAGYLTGVLNFWRGSSGKKVYDNQSGDWIAVTSLGYDTDSPGKRITTNYLNWVEAAFKFTDTGFEISTSRPAGMNASNELKFRPYFGRRDGMYIAASG